MQIYFFTAGVESNELRGNKLPNLQNLAALDEVTRQLTHDKENLNREPIYVICPVLNATSSLDRFVNIAEQEHRGVFLTFISSEISASDYKRLVRGGSADWASLQNAPQEILNIISRTSQSEPRSADAKPRPAIVARSCQAVVASATPRSRSKPRCGAIWRKRARNSLRPLNANPIIRPFSTTFSC